METILVNLIFHLSEYRLFPSQIVRQLSAQSAGVNGPDYTHLNIRYCRYTCWQRAQKDLKSTQAFKMLIYECDAWVTDIRLGAIWQVKLGVMLFDGSIQTAPATTSWNRGDSRGSSGSCNRHRHRRDRKREGKDDGSCRNHCKLLQGRESPRLLR